jgi:hypothetical protein
MSLLGSKRGWSSSDEQASTSTTDAETMSTYMNAAETTATIKRSKAQVRQLPSDHLGDLQVACQQLGVLVLH